MTRVACHHHQNSCGLHVSVRTGAGPSRPSMRTQSQNPDEPMPLARMNSRTPSRFATTVSSSAAAMPPARAYRSRLESARTRL